MTINQSAKKIPRGNMCASTTTIREAFAIQMMAAMRIANPESSSENVAIDALEDTRALLAALENSNG
ncbi:hypothetical protein ACQR5V_21475 [Xanthomonas oryzae pv. oryzicola]|uniref:hypothetical protein n=1 Tax=Xanthomonas oryzae TaxID=347 RepID=UPI0005CEDCE9|nr:hypothetical protein [Xanthomonas oryzae]AJQ88065.1 hypothetical protein BE73_14170 [Xanthomonas oryzae pv. oryzicola]AVU02490.1 hypothetical protein C0L90_08520 [Xanthomonas oryzae pv. oryzae]QBI15690.1 hypothetical protein EYR03_08590 [Xanthomonas oryzae pv. oryzae]QBI15739.1 hypothetical protein EYR03_08880 [Xanthomonas oryzae pv. oryzae]QBN38981.1 hypothetical protein EBA04_08570 [Xanthomonas oryzae pv. oryzae]